MSTDEPSPALDAAPAARWNPDKAARQLVAFAAGTGFGGLIQGASALLWIPPTILALIALFTSPGGQLHRTRNGGTNLGRILGFAMLIVYVTGVAVLGGIFRGELGPQIIPICCLWLAASLLSWQTLRANLDFTHVAIAHAGVLVAVMFLLLGSLVLWTAAAGGLRDGTTFFALGAPILLIAVVALRDETTRLVVVVAWALALADGLLLGVTLLLAPGVAVGATLLLVGLGIFLSCVGFLLSGDLHSWLAEIGMTLGGWPLRTGAILSGALLLLDCVMGILHRAADGWAPLPLGVALLLYGSAGLRGWVILDSAALGLGGVGLVLVGMSSLRAGVALGPPSVVAGWAFLLLGAAAVLAGAALLLRGHQASMTSRARDLWRGVSDGLCK